MNKNNTVETTQKSQTTTDIQSKNTKNSQKKSKVPTGKVVLLKETEARKKAREEQYRTFRINALKRRCKRMKISDEDTQKYVDKLIEQLNSSNNYHILMMFSAKDSDMVKQAMKNEGLDYKVMTSTHAILDGDSEVLGTLRGIMPPGTKICPYVIKKPSVLPIQNKKEVPKHPSKAARKSAAANAKLARKVGNMKMHKKVKKHFKTLQNVRNRNKAITVQMPAKKASEGSKIAKKAA